MGTDGRGNEDGAHLNWEFGFADVQFLHSGAQSAGIEVQNRRRARFAFDHPAGALQHLEDVSALHRFERSERWRCSRRILIIQTQFERVVDPGQSRYGVTGVGVPKRRRNR